MVASWWRHGGVGICTEAIDFWVYFDKNGYKGHARRTKFILNIILSELLSIQVSDFRGPN